MLLAQITDTHLRTDGAYPRHDPAAALACAVGLLNDMRPQPDAVIMTGDVNDRTARDYQQARAALALLRLPLLVVPGNHDRPDAFRAAFAGMLAHGRAAYAPDHLSFAAPVAGHVVIGLDSTSPKGPALLDTVRLDWLARELTAATVPVVLALHHPPFALGIPRLDDAPFPGADTLERLIRTSGKVVRVIAGHSHRAASRLWAGVPASTAPALGYALALSLEPGGPQAHTAEPPGLHLHLARNGAWITHTLMLGNTAPPKGLSSPLSRAEAALLIAPDRFGAT